ncbi:MAG TPA: hypothetical protein VFC00_21050 [Micromonosporaceae bacterium]|nr:hypothetical protein [Micromonosporaceae bacterium]
MRRVAAIPGRPGGHPVAGQDRDRRYGGTPTGSTPTATSTPSAATGSAAPTHAGAIGLVDISAVAVHPAAAGVGEVLNTYFSGINDKDFARATSVFDPAGVIDPNDPKQVAEVARDDSTSTVTGVVVRRIATEPTVAGALAVTATFRSTQAAGFGPHGRESETCTEWTVTYTMTSSADTYLILRGSGASEQCA